MVSMSDFNDSLHPRENTGKFTAKTNSAPAASLSAASPRQIAQQAVEEALSAYHEAPNTQTEGELTRASVTAVEAYAPSETKHIDFEWDEGGYLVSVGAESGDGSRANMDDKAWRDVDFYASNLRSPHEAGMSEVHPGTFRLPINQH